MVQTMMLSMLHYIACVFRAARTIQQYVFYVAASMFNCSRLAVLFDSVAMLLDATTQHKYGWRTDITCSLIFTFYNCSSCIGSN